jgi:hypothetical protein
MSHLGGVQLYKEQNIIYIKARFTIDLYMLTKQLRGHRESL